MAGKAVDPIDLTTPEPEKPGTASHPFAIVDSDDDAAPAKPTKTAPPKMTARKSSFGHSLSNSGALPTRSSATTPRAKEPILLPKHKATPTTPSKASSSTIRPRNSAGPAIKTSPPSARSSRELPPPHDSWYMRYGLHDEDDYGEDVLQRGLLLKSTEEYREFERAVWEALANNAVGRPITPGLRTKFEQELKQFIADNKVQYHFADVPRAWAFTAVKRIAMKYLNNEPPARLEMLAGTEDESSLSEVESEEVDPVENATEEDDYEEEEDDDEEEEDMGSRAQTMRDSPLTPVRQSRRPRKIKGTTPPKSTIGSSSPLITRLKEQRLKSKSVEKQASKPPRFNDDALAQGAKKVLDEDEIVDPKEQAEIAKLQKTFEGFHKAMQDDHAATVRWLLHDARIAIEDKEPLFMDKVSPFASMKSVSIASAAAKPPGTSMVKMNSWSMKKKGPKLNLTLVTKSITSDVPRVPRYYSYTSVRRNVLSANDERLRFIPFLGDEGSAKKKQNFNRLVVEMEEAFTEKKADIGRVSERLAQIRAYLDYWLKELDLGIVYKQLVRYFLEEDEEEEIELERATKNAILHDPEIIMSNEVSKTCRRLSKAFNNVFRYSLKEVIFRDEKLKEIAAAKKTESSPTQKDASSNLMDGNGAMRLGTYTELGCTICGAVWCQTHGDYQQDKKLPEIDSDFSDAEENVKPETTYGFRPVNIRYEDLLRQQDVREFKKAPELDLSISDDKPCSDNCYRRIDSSHMDTEYQFSAETLATIRSMTLSLRSKRKRSCDISFLLDLPCWQVENEINNLEPRTMDIVSPRPAKKVDWYDNKRKILKGYWQEHTTAHQHEGRGQANPCAHDGPCGPQCQCYNNNVLCETLCACSDDCPRRWTGCSCHGNGMLCQSDSCLCILMNRECGPQCISCGAIPRINPAYRHHDELFQSGCQNVPLQRGVPKKVVTGESQLAGFGLYLVEPVKKGQFLLEYAGEIVSGDEAERRGIIYDRKFLSFLFDLNSEWVIDAARLGNNSRFINHSDSEKDGLNCEAKIVLVNGEHRIKFIALRDLRVGEELLFNYGKKFAEKHGLSKKLPKMAKEGKVGRGALIVGDEALEALDGLRKERGTRGRGGGRGGTTRGRRARKSAKFIEAEKAAAEEMEMDDEDEEDDEEEEMVVIGGETRRKRKITRPKRYTR